MKKIGALKTIEVIRHDEVILIKLNRPDALNALNKQLREEVLETILPLDNDINTKCIIITGNGKAFAAGADIKEMSSKTYIQTYYENMFASWEKFAEIRTPKIAAVNGYALGGGCELAMMCDIIYAAKSAKFGQPEIKLGVIPGMGGSQRLTKLIGKTKAMDMILTGRMMESEEAERSGLVARVFEDEILLDETLKIAKTISTFGKASTMMAIEAIKRAQEVSLQEGLLFERRLFHSLFSTNDQKEGMRAFTEKRQPKFDNT